MAYCINCDNEPCICPKGEMKTITIEIDEETYDIAKAESGEESAEVGAARILTLHARRKMRRRPGPNDWMR